MTGRPAPGGVDSHLGSLGRDGVWGGLGVSGSSGFRGPGWPNGPPSPRLAPGGFYCVNTHMEYGFARGGPVPIEPA